MENNLVDNDDFKASRGWLEKFMKRNGLSLRRKTSVAQQDPDRMLAKLVSYVFQVRWLQEKHKYKASDIIAMDETPAWSDMLSETTVDATGKKSITLKSTGHEKARVSVCLAAKADRTKLKPIVVFKGAKGSRNCNFKTRIPTSSSCCIVSNRMDGHWSQDLGWLCSWIICIQSQAVSLGFLRMSYGR